MSSNLSKASEKRILDALEKAAGLINDGEDPSQAIIKTASGEQIPIGHVRLMVNAINTGTTNAKRLSTDDPMEKAADFPLANLEVVLGALYPSEVKKEATVRRETIVSDDYTKAPRWLEETRRKTSASRQVDWKLTDKKPIVERDPDGEYKRACIKVAHLFHEMEKRRLELHEVRDKTVKLAAEIRTYFKTPGHLDYEEVLDNSELLFGKQAAAVLGVVPEGGRLRGTQAGKTIDAERRPYSFVREGIKIAKQFAHCKRAYETAQTTLDREAEKTLRPFVPGPSLGRSVLGVQSLAKLTEKNAYLGGLLSKGFGLLNAADISRDIAKRVPAPIASNEQLMRDDLQSLMDPGHEAEIRNIQAEALLNDLMANDEVIRGYGPEEVIDSFNEISQVAPYAANRKALMRDLLRKRLSGGGQALDQFVLGDTLNTQQKMKDLNTIPDSNLSVLKDLGVIPNGGGTPRANQANVKRP